jgi:arylsulfatase A-like enzyme
MSSSSDGPDPYAGFQGKVGRTFASSEPWWPPRPTAPAGAPNVVVVLCDDLGFSDISCYGSEIATPNIDGIAAQGIRYGNFHVTPMCSPTRAALLTGRNAHAAGMGFVAHIDPGFPGYASELPDNQPSLAEVFRANGYSTLMVGKWHLAKDSDMSEAGDKNSWPLQRGFDQYYGFLEALTNFHHPHRMYDGNSVVPVDQYPDGYYLTDDLTDRAVRMIREVKTANPAKPLFMYFAHGAVHAPLHATRADMELFRGRYDIGWDRLRAQRFARQLELGVIPEGTRLPARNTEPGEQVTPWDELSDAERTLFARYMEVYAAMVHSIDRSVGRLREVLAEQGQLDNTIFIFTSDNGASREGKENGTTAYFRDGGTRIGASVSQVEDELAKLDDIGGPTTWPHYPRGWAMACNTPFRLYKLHTFAGGHQVPFVWSWPACYPEAGQQVRRQYTHITDVLPTLVDVIGLDMPTHRNGQPADQLAGRSFRPSLDDPDGPTTHPEQYQECMGNRSFIRGEWEAVTRHLPRTSFRDEHWHLFNVADDPTQIDDLADDLPHIVKDLIQGWDDAAWANQVYPLDEGTRLKYFLQPPTVADYTRPVRIVRGTPTLERARSAKLIAGRSFRITVDWAFQPGAEGVLLAHGGQDAGYLLYVENNQLIFLQNKYGPEVRALPAIPLGETSSQVIVDVHAPGGGIWNISLHVDGKLVATEDGFPQLIGFLPYEGIDVGIDRRSPVSWQLYQRRGCFPFTGELTAVTYQPGELAPDAASRLIEEARTIGLGIE